MNTRVKLGTMLIAGLLTRTALCEGVDPSITANALFPKDQPGSGTELVAVSPRQEDSDAAAVALRNVEERLHAVEARLGTPTRQPTITTTFERRVADIERRLEKVEQQLNQLRNLEQRLRKLEMQR